jgi:hypothetical protein
MYFLDKAIYDVCMGWCRDRSRPSEPEIIIKDQNQLQIASYLKVKSML